MIASKEVKPVVEEEFKPVDLNMFFMFPMAMMDLTLLISILKNIIRRGR